jgi:hypothetical protein
MLCVGILTPGWSVGCDFLLNHTNHAELLVSLATLVCQCCVIDIWQPTGSIKAKSSKLIERNILFYWLVDTNYFT